jgi:hypothetical protein
VGVGVGVGVGVAAAALLFYRRRRRRRTRGGKRPEDNLELNQPLILTSEMLPTVSPAASPSRSPPPAGSADAFPAGGVVISTSSTQLTTDVSVALTSEVRTSSTQLTTEASVLLTSEQPPDGEPLYSEETGGPINAAAQ